MGTTKNAPKGFDPVSARLERLLKKEKVRAANDRRSGAASKNGDCPSNGRTRPTPPAAASTARSGGRAATSRSIDDFSARLSALLSGTPSTMRAGDAAAPVAEDDAAIDPSGPVGTGEHVVKNGECVSCIARETGHFWETIWDEPENAELREVRADPNVLLEGDRVTVPALEVKQEACATEMRHRFVRRGEPSILRMRILKNQTPRAGEPFCLTVDGVEFQGVIDANGMLEVGIPGNARKAELWVGEGDQRSKYPIALGTVDPITTVTGVQRRLKNLGFQCGAVDGEIGPRTKAALKKFQTAYGLAATGEVDDSTRTRLKDEHGS